MYNYICIISNRNVGIVVQIIGPILDIEFPSGKLPKMYNAITVARAKNDRVVFEVREVLDANKVRVVSTSSTDGLEIGMEPVCLLNTL